MKSKFDDKLSGRDAIDRKIICELASNSGWTSEQLGARVGLSASATHRRVKLLEESGIITGYRAVLSPAGRGNPTTIFVAVTLTDQRRETLDAFETSVARADEVAEAHLITGEFDYMLRLLVKEGDSFERVHRDILAALPGVQRLVTQFSIRTVVGAQ
jgi:Lrp/AsnC family leucine-responsive transcriptional regulator